jgi:hypothetical protein
VSSAEGPKVVSRVGAGDGVPGPELTEASLTGGFPKPPAVRPG